MSTREEAEREALNLCDVLEEEFQLLHLHKQKPERRPRRPLLTPEEQQAETKRREEEFRAQVHALPEPRKALCFSGGGIRSATFCLGVLQGLASRDRLKDFHFLSTVSGGGYIGSWLSAWIREKGIDAVANKLRTPESGTNADPDPIRRLRAYSNYLSPVWGLSTDFFTLITIFLRNLVLNWCVFLPLLMAVLLIPRFQVALLATDPGGVVPWVTLALAALLVIVGIRYVTADLPGEVEEEYRDDPAGKKLSDAIHRPDKSARGPKNFFFAACFLPVLAAAVLLSWAGVWLGSPHASLDGGGIPKWCWYAAGGAAVHLVGVGLGMRYRKRRHITDRDSETSLWSELFFVLISGAAGGLLIYLAEVKFAAGVRSDAAKAGLYATLCVPLLLTCFWLATTLYAGLVARTSGEGDREWWARSGAWWLGAGLAWLVVCVFVIHMPQLILSPAVLEKVGGFESIGIGGGILGLITGAVGYWSKNGAKLKEKADGIAAKLGLGMLDFAALAFVVVLLVGLSGLNSWILSLAPYSSSSLDEPMTAAAYARVLHSSLWYSPLLLMCVLALGMSVVSRRIGANIFSLHGMYGNRLVRAYLGAVRKKRNPHWFTGFDPADNVDMKALVPDVGSPRLFHVVNVALNLVRASGDRLEWQQRKAAAFTISPLHSGGAHVGYLDSAIYSTASRGISLGRAMTISGAAASPNMGYHSSALVAFVMTFFNVRLGWWLPNVEKRWHGYWQKGEPESGLKTLLAEAFTGATEDSPYIYMSDGGHFENLALYEMVRRRCHEIFAVDAGCDSDFTFEDLENAIRKIRVDLGVPIEFPGGLPTPEFASKTGFHHVKGVIRYSAVDPGAPDGCIIYVKPVISGSEPVDVLRYAADNNKAGSAFPHQTTADQFFDEAQFESYRALGRHSVDVMFDDELRAQRMSVTARTVTAGTTAAAAPFGDGGAGGFVANVADTVGSMSRTAMLATAVTVGGVVGVTGTVALKPGSELALKKEDRELLAKGMPLVLTPSPALEEALGTQVNRILAALDRIKPGDGGGGQPDPELKKVVQELAEAVRVLGASLPDKSQWAALEGYVKRIEVAIASGRNTEKIVVEVTKELREAMVLVRTSLTDGKGNAVMVSVVAALDRVEEQLKAISDNVQGIGPRRNIRGVEGGAR